MKLTLKVSCMWNVSGSTLSALSWHYQYHNKRKWKIRRLLNKNKFSSAICWSVSLASVYCEPRGCLGKNRSKNINQTQISYLLLVSTQFSFCALEMSMFSKNKSTRVMGSNSSNDTLWRQTSKQQTHEFVRQAEEENLMFDKFVQYIPWGPGLWLVDFYASADSSWLTLDS